jgi:hypothetical protein
MTQIKRILTGFSASFKFILMRVPWPDHQFGTILSNICQIVFMKPRLLVLMLAGFIICQSSNIFGQALGNNYKTAIGVKFYPGAFSIKHFIKSKHALEGLGYFWYDGARFTGLYQIHGDIEGAKAALPLVLMAFSD